jgi:alpha-galactosidase
MGLEKVRVWVASGTGRERSQRFLAVFNLDNKPVSVDTSWNQLGLSSGNLTARDLWEGHNLPASAGLKIELPAHGCILYAVGPR